MQFLRPFMGSPAIFTITLALTVLETGVTAVYNKPISCCQKLSFKKITVPILDYKFQKKNPPCVNAVVFETTEGFFCCHWPEKWVQEAVRRINQMKNLRKTTSFSTKSMVTSRPTANSTAAARESLSVK